jgi:hypothetical protein
MPLDDLALILTSFDMQWKIWSEVGSIAFSAWPRLVHFAALQHRISRLCVARHRLQSQEALEQSEDH